MTDFENIYAIPAAAAERLLSAHDGDVALLYLYRLAHPGALDREAAAGVLCRTLRDIESAEEKLARLALPELSSPEPVAAASPERETDAAPGAETETAVRDEPPAAQEPPQFGAETIVRRVSESPELEALFRESDAVLGRHTTKEEMALLLDLHDGYGLPVAVLLMLLHYCEERFERDGHRKPPYRWVYAEGKHWAELEIHTIDMADAHIRHLSELQENSFQVQRLLGLQGRRLSSSERKYVESWLELGFPIDSIAIAYDRTVTNTGRLKWAYMDTILRSWHEKKLHTPAEIDSAEPRRGRGNDSRRGAPDKSVNTEALDTLISNI